MLHLLIIGILCAVPALSEGTKLIGLKSYESKVSCNFDEKIEKVGRPIYPQQYNVDADEFNCATQIANRTSCFFYADFVQLHQNSKNYYCNTNRNILLGKKKNSRLNVEFTFKKRHLLWSEKNQETNSDGLQPLMKTKKSKKFQEDKISKLSQNEKKKLKQPQLIGHKRRKRNLENKSKEYLDKVKIDDELDINKRIEKLVKKVALENLRTEESTEHVVVVKSTESPREITEPISESFPFFNSIKKILRLSKEYFSRNNNENSRDNSVSVNVMRGTDSIANVKAHISNYDILKSLRKRARLRRHIPILRLPSVSENKKKLGEKFKIQSYPNSDNLNDWKNLLKLQKNNDFVSKYKRKKRSDTSRSNDIKEKVKYENSPLHHKVGLIYKAKSGLFDKRRKRKNVAVKNNFHNYPTKANIHITTNSYLGSSLDLQNQKKIFEKNFYGGENSPIYNQLFENDKKIEISKILNQSPEKSPDRPSPYKGEGNSNYNFLENTVEKPMLQMNSKNKLNSMQYYDSGEKLNMKPYGDKYDFRTDLPAIETDTEQLNKKIKYHSPHEFLLNKNRYLKLRHALRSYVVENNALVPIKKKNIDRGKRCGKGNNAMSRKCWRAAPLLCIPYIRKGQDDLLKYVIKTLQKMLGKPFPQKVDIFEKTKFKPCPKKDDTCEDIMPEEDTCETKSCTATEPCTSEASTHKISMEYCTNEERTTEGCPYELSCLTTTPCPTTCRTTTMFCPTTCPTTTCPTTTTCRTTTTCPTTTCRTTTPCSTTTTCPTTTCPTTNPCSTTLRFFLTSRPYPVTHRSTTCKPYFTTPRICTFTPRTCNTTPRCYTRPTCTTTPRMCTTSQCPNSFPSSFPNFESLWPATSAYPGYTAPDKTAGTVQQPPQVWAPYTQQISLTQQATQQPLQYTTVCNQPSPDSMGFSFQQSPQYTAPYIREPSQILAPTASHILSNPSVGFSYQNGFGSPVTRSQASGLFPQHSLSFSNGHNSVGNTHSVIQQPSAHYSKTASSKSAYSWYVPKAPYDQNQFFSLTAAPFTDPTDYPAMSYQVSQFVTQAGLPEYLISPNEYHRIASDQNRAESQASAGNPNQMWTYFRNVPSSEIVEYGAQDPKQAEPSIETNNNKNSKVEYLPNEQKMKIEDSKGAKLSKLRKNLRHNQVNEDLNAENQNLRDPMKFIQELKNEKFHSKFVKNGHHRKDPIIYFKRQREYPLLFEYNNYPKEFSDQSNIRYNKQSMPLFFKHKKRKTKKNIKTDALRRQKREDDYYKTSDGYDEYLYDFNYDDKFPENYFTVNSKVKKNVDHANLNQSSTQNTQQNADIATSWFPMFSELALAFGRRNNITESSPKIESPKPNITSANVTQAQSTQSTKKLYLTEKPAAALIAGENKLKVSESNITNSNITNSNITNASITSNVTKSNKRASIIPSEVKSAVKSDVKGEKKGLFAAVIGNMSEITSKIAGPYLSANLSEAKAKISSSVTGGGKPENNPKASSTTLNTSQATKKASSKDVTAGTTVTTKRTETTVTESTARATTSAVTLNATETSSKVSSTAASTENTKVESTQTTSTVTVMTGSAISAISRWTSSEMKTTVSQSTDAKTTASTKVEKDSARYREKNYEEGQVPTTLKFASIVKGPKRMVTKPSPKMYLKVFPDSLPNDNKNNESTSVAAEPYSIENIASTQVSPESNLRLQLLAVCEGYLEVVKLIKAQNQSLEEELDADLAHYCENIISQSFNSPAESVSKTKKNEQSQSETLRSTTDKIQDTKQIDLKNSINSDKIINFISSHKILNSKLKNRKVPNHIVVNSINNQIDKREVDQNNPKPEEIRKKISTVTDKLINEKGKQMSTKEKISSRSPKWDSTSNTENHNRCRRKEDLDDKLLKKGLPEEQVELLQLLRRRKKALLSWLFNSKENQIKPDEFQETEYIDDEDCDSPIADIAEASGTITPKGNDRTSRAVTAKNSWVNDSVFPVYAKQYGYNKGGELREVEVLWRSFNEKTHKKRIVKNVTVLALLLTSTEASEVKNKKGKLILNDENEEGSADKKMKKGNQENSSDVPIPVNNSTVSNTTTSEESATVTSKQSTSSKKNGSNTYSNKPDPSTIVGNPPNSSSSLRQNLTHKISHKLDAAKGLFQEYTIEFLNYAVYILPIMFTLLFVFCCVCCFLQVLKNKRKKKKKKMRKKKKAFSSESEPTEEFDSDSSEAYENEMKKKRREMMRKKKKAAEEAEHRALEKTKSKAFWNVLKMNSGKPSSEFQEDTSQTEKKKSFLRFLKGKRDEDKADEPSQVPLHALEEKPKRTPDSDEKPRKRQSDDSDREGLKKKKEDHSEATDRRELIALLEELKKIETENVANSENAENAAEKKERKSVYVQYMTQEEQNPFFKNPDFPYPYQQNKYFGMPSGEYPFHEEHFLFHEQERPSIGNAELYEDVGELSELIPCECNYYSSKHDCLRHADFRINREGKCERFFKMFRNSNVTHNKSYGEKNFIKSEDKNYIFNKYRANNVDSKNSIMGGSRKLAETEITLPENLFDPMSPFTLASRKKTGLMDEMENLKRRLNKKNYVRLKDDGVLCRL